MSRSHPPSHPSHPPPSLDHPDPETDMLDLTAAMMGDGFDQAMMSLGEGDFSSIFGNDVFPLTGGMGMGMGAGGGGAVGAVGEEFAGGAGYEGWE